MIREYIWYSPELDSHVIQTIIDGCIISFEWHPDDLFKAMFYKEDLKDKYTSVDDFLWIPIGEI